jgi:hypothetical protein
LAPAKDSLGLRALTVSPVGVVRPTLARQAVQLTPDCRCTIGPSILNFQTNQLWWSMPSIWYTVSSSRSLASSPPNPSKWIYRQESNCDRWWLFGIGIRLFNRLPRTIQSLRKDRISFKNNLFSYLMNNSFCTVDTFLEHTINN